MKPGKKQILSDIDMWKGRLDLIKDQYQHALNTIAKEQELEDIKSSTEVTLRNQCRKLNWFQCLCHGDPTHCTRSRPIEYLTPVLGNVYFWCGDYGASGPGTCGSRQAQKETE